MKKILSIIIILAGFVFSSAVAFGQNKFALSTTVAQFFGHINSQIVLIVPSPNTQGNFNSVIKSKSKTQGYWIGLNGRYSFSTRWSASIGLWLSKSRQNVPEITTDPTVTFITGRSRSHNFVIPVMVNYQTSERKLSPYFSAGTLWNFNSVSRMDISDSETAIFKSKGSYSRITPIIGAGMIYNFAHHLSLVAQPTFSYAFPASGNDSRAYRLSFNAQLMYKF